MYILYIYYIHVYYIYVYNYVYIRSCLGFFVLSVGGGGSPTLITQFI